MALRFHSVFMCFAPLTLVILTKSHFYSGGKFRSFRTLNKTAKVPQLEKRKGGVQVQGHPRPLSGWACVCVVK